jgi:hypothetical protein
MITDIATIERLAKERESENRNLRKKLLTIPLKQVDELFIPLAKEAEQAIDCTTCGNCCKKLEPEISEEEVERLAALASSGPAHFKQTQLGLEPDTGIQFMKARPCCFLSGTKCSIYTNRPASCKDYPHLHHPKIKFRMKKILDQYGVCPIVFNSIEALKEKIQAMEQATINEK